MCMVSCGLCHIVYDISLLTLANQHIPCPIRSILTLEESGLRGTHGAPMSNEDDGDGQLISEKIRVAETAESAKSIAKRHSNLFK